MKSKYRFSTIFAAGFCAVAFLGGTVEEATANDLIVSDQGSGKVFRVTPEGVGHRVASVYTAEGLAFDSSGNLYVTDFNESIIFKIGPNGRKKRIASGDFVSNPSEIAFDSSDNLFVATNGDHLGISKVEPDGTVSSFAKGLAPTGLAFDAEGNLYATDYITNTVMKFTPDGTGTIFARGFGQPADVAFDAAGNLFVSDLLDLVIYKITPEGTKSVFASGLSQPLGLAFDPDGNLFVADYPRIVKIAPDGTQSIFKSGVAPCDLAFRP